MTTRTLHFTRRVERNAAGLPRPTRWLTVQFDLQEGLAGLAEYGRLTVRADTLPHSSAGGERAPYPTELELIEVIDTDQPVTVAGNHWISWREDTAREGFGVTDFARITAPPGD